MPSQFTLPSVTRTVGSGDPPGDINAVVAAANALGATYNVLNAAYAGGADPGGANDSTAAIQAALNAIPAGGGVVYFPAGTYKLSSALAVKTQTTLQGAGAQTTVLSQTSTSANGLTITDGTAVVVRDLQIAGPGSGTGKGIAGVLSSASSLPYLDFHDIRVQTFGGNGIDLDTAIVSTFTRVVSASNGGHGFALHSSSVSTSCAFTACYALSNTGRGYDLNTVMYSTLTGCAADSNAYGYYLTACAAVTLTSCGAEACTTDNFVLTGGYANSLLSCRCYANAHYGVHVTGSEKAAFITAFREDTPSGATNSVITDAGTTSFIINWSTTTALSLGGTCTNIDQSGNFAVGSGGTTYLGTTQVYGVLNVNAGSDTAGSAPVITPAFSSGVAAQLSDLTRDYMVYLQIGTAGTAMSVTIGHTNAASDATLVSSAVATAGEVITFRVPAGWYVKWSATTATLTHQAAVGC